MFRLSLRWLRQLVGDLLASTRNQLLKLVHYQLFKGAHSHKLSSGATLLLGTIKFHKDELGSVKSIYISFKHYYANGLPGS